MSDRLDLAAILCSRLCHDLVNPVGAVTNGIEILRDEDDPDMQEQVLGLLEQSTDQVACRLGFYRLAFGAGSGMGDTIDAGKLREASEAFFGGGKIALDWQLPLEQISKDGGKVLLNLVLVAAESLLRGGGIAVLGREQDGKLVIEVTAQGERLLIADGVDMALSGEVDVAALSPKAAPAYLAAATASEKGGKVEWAERDGGQLHFLATLAA